MQQQQLQLKQNALFLFRLSNGWAGCKALLSVI